MSVIPQPPAIHRLPAEVIRDIILECDDERPIPGVDKPRKAIFDAVQNEMTLANEMGIDLDEEEDAPDDRLLLQEEMVEPSPLNGKLASLGWIRLAHVCRRWRDIAMQCQSIWARHIGSLPKAYSRMLELSGGTAPVCLSMYGSSYRDDYGPVLQGFLRNPLLRERIIEMCIIETRASALATLWTAIARCDLPNLKSLVVVGNEVEARPDDMESPTLTCPLLHSMRLVNFLVNPSTANLRRLSLKTQRLVHEQIPPFAIHATDLADVLDRCSSTIQELELQVLIVDREDGFTSRQPITLPSLRLLIYAEPDAREEDEKLLPLFSMLRYPNTTVVKIGLEIEDCVSTPQGVELFRALRIAGTLDPVTLTLEIEDYDSAKYAYCCKIQYNVVARNEFANVVMTPGSHTLADLLRV
ncbi:unnamed protein product [Peniophora sp. CBMAI 1063]|nr:unnamed protein product [Peniophora sp. CBMAI 1063]